MTQRIGQEALSESVLASEKKDESMTCGLSLLIEQISGGLERKGLGAEAAFAQMRETIHALLQFAHEIDALIVLADESVQQIKLLGARVRKQMKRKSLERRDVGALIQHVQGLEEGSDQSARNVRSIVEGIRNKVKAIIIALENMDQVGDFRPEKIGELVLELKQTLSGVHYVVIDFKAIERNTKRVLEEAEIFRNRLSFS